jgi:transcriptional regulator
MYVPGEFVAADDSLVWSVIEEHPFAVLLSQSDGKFSQLPFLISRAQGQPNKLRGHVASRNPLASQLQGAPVSVLFTGPDTYVSPQWYEHPNRQVPTWNYVAVEVQGHSTLLGPDATRAFLDDLCARFEGPNGYRPTELPPALLAEMLAEIVAFEVVVEKIVGKFKLSQNRSAEDRNRVMSALATRASTEDLKVLEWMRRVLG